MSPIRHLRAVAIAAMVWLVPAFASAQTTTVTVIHGINGTDLGAEESLPVDVFVSGLGCALKGIPFRSISPRLEVPADTYDIRVSLVDEAAGECEGPVAIDAPGVPFEEGKNTTVIAHLSAEGAPIASVFENDLSLGEEGDGRAALHHTAAAPEVDLRAYRLRPWKHRGPALELLGVPNGVGAAQDLRAGLYVLSIAPAGARPIAYEFFHIEHDVTTAFYVVGSAGKGSLEVLRDAQDQASSPETEAPASVTVIHGIPGIDLGLDPELPVDIYVGGVGCALTDVIFGAISPRLELPAGAYDIEVRLAIDGDEGCGGDTAISAPGVPFDSGESSTVIAHLTADGGITASKFVNDLSDTNRRYKGRVALHHTANAPAVDIKVYRSIFYWWKRALSLMGVENGDAADADLWRGRYVATIAPAGAHPIFKERFEVYRGEAVRIYAVGSLVNETFTLIADRQALDR